MHTCTSGYLLKSEDDRHTRTCTLYTHNWSRMHKHVHIRACLPWTLSGVLSLHANTNSCLLEILFMMTLTYSYLCLIAWINTHAPRDAFLFHTYRSVSLTHMQLYINLHTYFTSVGRAFLVETVVLQIVLWDIWVWSTRFLVYLTNYC